MAEAQWTAPVSQNSYWGLKNMERKGLSVAERRRAVKARLSAKGIEFDPSKFRPVSWARRFERQRARKEALLRRKQEGSVDKRTYWKASYPSSAGTYKKEGTKGNSLQNKTTTDGPKEISKTDLTLIKIAIAPEGFPKNKFSEEQGELIQVAMVGEIQRIEFGNLPQFHGSCMEKGEVIFSCLNQETATWVRTVATTLKPWDDAKLVVRERNNSPATKVSFKTPKLLLNTESSQVMAMLDNQNPSFRVSEWRTISNKNEANGQVFECLVEDTALAAIKKVDCRAYLALWRIPITITQKSNDKRSEQ